MTFNYEPAQWNTVVGHCQPGAQALIDYAHERGFGDVGCFNDRAIAGTSTPSLHREGRAVDLTQGTDGVAFDTFLDDLIDAHDRLHVQQVIYFGQYWRIGNIGWRQLATDADQHYSHAHVELTWEGAASNTLDLYHNLLDRMDIEPPTESDEGTMYAPTLYRDVDYANVFAIFPSGEVIHCSSALVEHYQGIGSGPVIVADPTNPQTLKSLLAKAGFTGTDALVPFGL